jgi:hypothetical protein
MTYESPSARIVHATVERMLAQGAEPIVEVCCDAHFDSAYGTRMFSITRSVRNCTPRWTPNGSPRAADGRSPARARPRHG